MLIATILGDVVVDVREYDEIPAYSPMFINVDVSHRGGTVEVGYIYDKESDSFRPNETSTNIEPEPMPEPMPTPEEMQAQTLVNTEYLVIMSELANL